MVYVAAEGGTKRAGLAASSPQEELVVVEPETSEHTHKRLRKGKAQVVESDDDEQMDESAPAESAAPKRVADVPDSAEAEEGDADGEPAAGDAAAASSSTTAVASVASGSTKDQKTPAKENERPVAAEGGTKRAGRAASSPQEEN